MGKAVYIGMAVSLFFVIRSGGLAEKKNPLLDIIHKQFVKRGIYSQLGYGQIHSVAYSPKGDYIAVATSIGIRLLDRRTYKEIGWIGRFIKHFSLSISRDGKWIASGNPRAIRIWSVAKGNLVSVFPIDIPSSIISKHQVLFAPNESYVLSGNFGLNLINIQNGKKIEILKPARIQDTLLPQGIGVRISLDGKYIAAIGTAHNSDCGYINLVDVASNKRKIIYGYIRALAFSHDSQLLAATTCENTIVLLNPKSCELIKRFIGHDGGVTSMDFSPDDKYLATGSWDQTVRIWDIEHNRELKKWGRFDSGVLSVSFSPEGKSLIASTDNSIRIWNYTSQYQRKISAGHISSVEALKYSPSGDKIAFADRNDVIIWDLVNGNLHILKGHRSYVKTIQFMADERHIVSGSDDDTLRIWDASTGAEVKKLSGHLGSIYAIVLNRKNDILVSASRDGTVRLWDVKRGKEIRKVFSSKYPVKALTYANQSDLLAFSCEDKVIYLYSFVNNRLVQIPTREDFDITSIVFSKDDQYLLGLGFDANRWQTKNAKIILWNLKTLQPVYKVNQPASALALSPDGTLFAIGSFHNNVRVYQFLTGKLLHRYTGHTSLVNALSFHPVKNILASGSNDGTIILWNLKSSGRQ